MQETRTERGMSDYIRARSPEHKRERMEAIMARPFTAPIAAGDVLIENVCGCGVDVIATKAVP